MAHAQEKSTCKVCHVGNSLYNLDNSNRERDKHFNKMGRRQEMMCKVKGCDRKVHSRMWCNAHYGRWYKTGKIGSAKIGRHGRPNKSGIDWNNREEVNKYRLKWKSRPYMHKYRFGGLRLNVLRRDSYICQVCEMTDDEHREKWNCEITIDHIDGKGRYSETKHHSMSNLWTLCLSCHGRRDFYRWWLSKGKTVPVELIETLRLE